MHILRDKITRQNIFPVLISSILLLGVWISLILHFPGAGRRNPPFHKFGGFNFDEWWIEWAIYGGQFLIALVLLRSRFSYRPMLIAVVVVLAICLVVQMTSFLIALGRPSI